MYHFYECLLLKSPCEKKLPISRLALRTVVLVLDDQKRNSSTVSYGFEHRRTYDDLLTHADLRCETSRKEAREFSAGLGQFLSGQGHSIPSDLIMNCLHKINVNCHRVLDYDVINTSTLGMGLYLAISKLDHTCETTDEYAQLFAGNRMLFRALKNFKVANSLSLHPSLDRRQKHLKKRYFSRATAQGVWQSRKRLRFQCSTLSTTSMRTPSPPSGKITRNRF